MWGVCGVCGVCVCGVCGGCVGGVLGVSGVGWGLCYGGELVSLAALLSGYLGKSGHLPR